MVQNAANSATASHLTVIVLDEAVEEDTGHRDGVAREVGVVVHALTDLEASRGIPVPSEKREDVVLYTAFSA